MLDYDSEADHYDASRGGEGRAVAAAKAVTHLLPNGTRTLVDLACGTGIVTRHLADEGRLPAKEPGHDQGRVVIGVDRSPGMLARASRRLPGSVVLGDATQLPLATASVDAVVIIWLLHLVPDAGPVLVEAARILRPSGVLITTVDKDESAFAVPSDVAAVTQQVRAASAPAASDRRDQIIALAGEHGLRPAGETSFPGTGQGRSPRQWQEQILSNRTAWFRNVNGPDADQAAALCRDLSRLPDQERPRPDPVYRLIACRLPAA